MSNEKQTIEEMARIICKPTANKGNCDKCGFKKQCSKFDDATDLYNAGYRKQIEGEWEEMGQDYANCSVCGTIFEALPTLYVFKRNNIYCRHCGARMKGGTE